MKILSAGIDEINFDISADSFNGHMTFLNKPSNALWGSTYTPQDYYKSDWLCWCINEDFELDRYNHGVIYNLHKTFQMIWDVLNGNNIQHTLHYQNHQLFLLHCP